MSEQMRKIQRDPELRLSLDNEITVDNFAGGGGASTGIEQGLGRSIDIAINHDPEAIALHKANHPQTKHYVSDVFEINPRRVCEGRPVGLAWFSPDCKHFSKAKGNKPVDKKIRGLAWVAIRWAASVKPRVIMLENVEEFKTWGPLLETGYPCPDSKGFTFRRFIARFEELGYKVEYRELRASNYGAPTIRKRLFIIARCDGQPIIWPEATHGKLLQPYNTAGDCIEWSVPAKSIFNRKRPLAENTMRRIAKGLKRYVVDADNPFVVNFITEHANGSSQRNMPINEPLRTICASTKGGHFALVSVFLNKNNIGVVEKSSEVYAFLIKYYGTAQGSDLNEPMHTLTTKDRMGLITVHGENRQIEDIKMRMLTPRENYRAQGFPDEYKINIDIKGKPLTKAAQIRMCGNSVSPPVARAIVEANIN